MVPRSADGREKLLLPGPWVFALLDFERPRNGSRFESDRERPVALGCSGAALAGEVMLVIVRGTLAASELCLAACFGLPSARPMVYSLLSVGNCEGGFELNGFVPFLASMVNVNKTETETGEK